MLPAYRFQEKERIEFWKMGSFLQNHGRVLGQRETLLLVGILAREDGLTYFKADGLNSIATAVYQLLLL